MSYSSNKSKRRTLHERRDGVYRNFLQVKTLGMIEILFFIIVIEFALVTPYPNITFMPRPASTAYTYPVHASNYSIFYGMEQSGGLTETTMKDFQYHMIASWRKSTGMRFSERLKVVYNVPIVNSSAIRFSAEVREYYQGNPTSVRYTYKIHCLNASGHTVLEKGVTSMDETQSFPVPQEITQIELSCEKKYWFWESDYSLMLKVDLLEITATQENQAPIVITNPQISGAPVYLGNNISMWGELFQDPDGEYTPLTYTSHWEVNHTNTVSIIPYETTHNLTLDSGRFSVNDRVRGVVTATDSMGLWVIATTSWLPILNTPPIINSITLVSNEANNSIAYRTSTLTCLVTCTENNPDQDLTIIYEWRQNGQLKTYSPDNYFHLTIVNSSVNDLISCTAIPYDGWENGTEQTASMIVQNHLAWIDGPVVITPNNPHITDDLTVIHAPIYDLDNDAYTITYMFYRIRDTVITCIQNSSSPVLNHTLGLLQLNDSVYVMVVINDTWTVYGTGYCQTTPSIIVENTNPRISVINVEVFDAAGTTLLFNPSLYRSNCQLRASVQLEDSESQLMQAKFTWYRTSSLQPLQEHTIVADINHIAVDWLNGAVAGLSHGDQIFVVITALDGIAYGDSNVTEAIIIQNDLPIITKYDLSPLPLSKQADVMVEVSANDLDGDAIYFDVVYYRNAQPYLIGSMELPQACLTHGDIIYATIRPYDLFLGMKNYGKLVTTNSYVVENTHPTIQSVALPCEVSSDTEQITAQVYVTDIDKDELHVTYIWMRNSVPIVGYNTSTLTRSYFAKDDQIQCIVTAIDSYDGGRSLPISSNIVTIRNTAPKLWNVTIGVTLADIVYAVPVVFSDDVLQLMVNCTDIDQTDNLIIETRWYVNGAEIPDATNSLTLNRSYFTPQDHVQAQIRISDGEVATNWVWTGDIAISSGSRFALVDWSKIQTMSPRMISFLMAVFIGTLVIGIGHQRWKLRKGHFAWRYLSSMERYAEPVSSHYSQKGGVI